uniref:Uncharacterized protein n=1 Tax=Tanacetum cinerariifolium TaxID=118510 RepID=A0A699H6W7_TANCI|nr:hypothetical protein [Tanacetum cinerariifolium]
MKDKNMAKQSMDSSSEKLWYLADEDDEKETFVFDMNEFPAIQIHNNLSSKSTGTHESLNRLLMKNMMLFYLKFVDHKKVDKEIIEGVVGTWLIQSYRKQFEEYMEIKRRLEVNGIDTDMECDPTNVEFAIWRIFVKLEEYWWGKKEKESSEDAWSNHLPNDELEHYGHTTYIKTDVDSNYDSYNNVCRMFKNGAGINNDNDAVQANQELFNDHEAWEMMISRTLMIT